MIWSRIQKWSKRTWANWRFREMRLIDLEEALVSFTFDDAPASAFRTGGSILTNQAYQGTYYVALSLLNQAETAGGFALADLRNATSAGHHLGCHTYGHLDVSQMSCAEAVHDINHNQAQLETLLPGTQMQHFSYPFGSQTRAIKMHLSSRFKTARGIGHGVNVGSTDILNLKTIKLYRDHYSLPEVALLIDQARAQKAWLIFYTHDVKDSPSAYGCTPAYFAAVVQMVKNKSVRVCTVEEAYQKIMHA